MKNLFMSAGLKTETARVMESRIMRTESFNTKANGKLEWKTEKVFYIKENQNLYILANGKMENFFAHINP